MQPIQITCRAAIVLLMFAAPLSAAEDVISESELVRRTQELFDAVARGNSQPWQKYFAADCLYFDEKGRSMDKSALVADIQPLPPGYSGAIKLGKVSSRFFPGVAIMSYDLDETETIFGQNLSARYHQTDTWVRGNGDWQIIASQAFRYYEDPAVGRVDPKKLPAFIGKYQLGPDRTRTVMAEGDRLFLESKGKREELFPETSELFFRKGVDGRILFQMNENGKVQALIDRRNNEDVIWQKVQ